MRKGVWFAALLGAMVLVLANSGAAYAQCSEGTQMADDCGLVSTYEGCCQGEVVMWCENGVTCGIDCTEGESVCTWKEGGGFYGCDLPPASADPSGTFPMACGPCTPNCDGKVCGSDGCGGSCGTCPGEADVCVVGQCCTPSCDGKTCGDDGCGGTCGECPCGNDCEAGACVYHGCDGKACGCDGCGNKCGDCPGDQVCGAGNQCCTPTCGDAVCGDDGCGGQCGFCGCGEECVLGACVFAGCEGRCGMDPCGKQDCGACPDNGVCIDGQCCTPDCEGKLCGDDGCGGTCGACGDGQYCDDGACADAGVCGADPAASCSGGCGSYGTGDCYCDSSCTAYGDCCPDYAACCLACTPSCADLPCGSDDGCGGYCGCPGHETCEEGVCTPCVPACEDKTCGSDGCGGVCGVCFGATPVCIGTECVPDTCNGYNDVGCCDGNKLMGCWGNEVYAVDCGADDPASICGWYPGSEDGYYPPGYYCGPETDPNTGEPLIIATGDPSGENPMQCKACVSNCFTADHACKQCGNDGCGGTCGTCSECGNSCVDGFCAFTACEGKQCGDDGCGGSCGTCEAGYKCDSNTCVPEAWTCTASYYNAADGCDCNCGVKDPDCDIPDASVYGCYDFAHAACSEEGTCVCLPGCELDGLECGDDGCGGSCGDCDAGMVCNYGTCCTPACDGKVCGDDGCGSTCGECGASDVCTFDGQCCTPSCEGKSCDADNGCGSTCGCADGLVCSAGECIEKPFECLGLNEPSAMGCDMVDTMEGCCNDMGWVVWCDGGNTFCIPCSDAQDPAYQSCGWSVDAGYYDCGQVGPDPSGENPLACAGGCTPNCDGKACDADNGCGQPCGCEAGKSCEAGVCVACEAKCAGKVCGDDGCGGQCGECTEGTQCDEFKGQCVDPCYGITYEGCCDGDVVKFCENATLTVGDCNQTDEGPKCGWMADQSYYWCGTDGSEDPTGEHPIACPCVPVCDGKTCADDNGCGQPCGCPSGWECKDGECTYDTECVPGCDGNTCGNSDGCGGTCGCAAGKVCQDGTCQCAPQCAGKDCGPDGCGGECGGCGGDGAVCTAEGTCCQKQCDGKECGDDGCGGVCGACPGGATCNGGTCVMDEETIQPEVDKDVTPVETTDQDTTTEKDTTGGGDDGGGGGCSVNGGANGTSLALLLGALAFLGLALRRRENA